MTMLVAISVPEGIVMSADSMETVHRGSEIIINGLEAKKLFNVAKSGAGYMIWDSLSGILNHEHIKIQQYENNSPYEISTKIRGYIGGLDKKSKTGVVVCGYEGNEPVLYTYLASHGERLVQPNYLRLDKHDPDNIKEEICDFHSTLHVREKKTHMNKVHGNFCLCFARYDYVEHIKDVDINNLSLDSAIKYSEELIEYTINKMNENKEKETPSVGGPIDILVITKEGSHFHKHKS